MDYRAVSAGYVTIGTQLLNRPAAQEPGHPWDEHVPPPGRDATLLAIVPIPGTQTSLAIVGYAITAPATSSGRWLPDAARPVTEPCDATHLPRL